MRCSQCGGDLDPQDANQLIASIAGSIMGDEQIDSYFLCSRCGVYTLEVYFDRFLGEDEVTVIGPISKEEGDAKVAMIKECSESWDKKCRCPAHKKYFQGWLD